jgi:hypothetical protein
VSMGNRAVAPVVAPQTITAETGTRGEAWNVRSDCGFDGVVFNDLRYLRVRIWTSSRVWLACFFRILERPQGDILAVLTERLKLFKSLTMNVNQGN